MTITSSCQGLGAPPPWGAACRPSLRLSPIAPGDGVAASSCPRTRPTNRPASCSNASRPSALPRPNRNAAAKAFDSRPSRSHDHRIKQPRPWRAPSLGRGLPAQPAAVPHRSRRCGRGELVPKDPTDEPASELLARIQAQRANAPKRTAWRSRQRPTTRSSHTATQGTHAWMQNRLKPSPRNCSPP